MWARAEITGVWNVLRIMGWSVCAILLVLPLVAMRFTDEVNWTESDFIVTGVMLGSAGFSVELLVRQSSSHAYRIGAVLAVLAGFLTVWANLAVGMIGDEDNPYNLLFGGVLLIAMIGAVLARFRAGGMALALLVTAAAQTAVGAFGLTADISGGVLSMAFAGLWLLAAALFWNTAREPAPVR